MRLAAEGILYGIDPDRIIDRGREDSLLQLAILSKVKEDYLERTQAEYTALSKMIAQELAQILRQIF